MGTKTHAGGSRLSRPNATTATTTDATSASLPHRHHPSRNSVLTFHDNRSIILYVTVVTAKRNAILANKTAYDRIVDTWKETTEWLVGRYVIMPDHIHFFCSPSSYPIPDFHKWVKKWKAQISRTFPLELRPNAAFPRLPALFQRDCWDRQLRTGDSYTQKWEYVRNNPVRKGLVANADNWPYQGELNTLSWHEKL